MSTSSTTSSATAHAPKPVEASAKPAQAGARAPKDKPEGGDIFSSLLNLLASTHVLPEAATALGDAPADARTDKGSDENGPANPLAALMDWGLPSALRGASARQSEGAPGLPGATRATDPGTEGSDGTIDISDMTAVDATPVETLQLEAAPKGTVALPANSPRAGVSFVPAARATDAFTASAAWRRAPAASTETVALQQTANQAAHQAAVAQPARSTVALNERFGLTAGVSQAPTDRREAPLEGFSLPNPVGPGNRAPDAASGLAGAVAGDAAMGSDSTGSDPRAFDQADGQTDNPFADMNAGEEPTVTHWGTQHLRHASLRVGGEGEQAIDIQLSMKGQEVEVAFKTDNAEARASLRENAGESLSDLLAKSGIQLGGVSVGAQGQQGARGGGAAARQSGIQGVASAPLEPLASANRPAPVAPRADGSHPLDVFA